MELSSAVRRAGQHELRASGIRVIGVYSENAVRRDEPA